MNDRDTKFDDIRPYYEEEIPAAMERIAQHGSFPLLASYVYPHEDIEKPASRYALTRPSVTSSWR